ncbi:prepilin peptidase [Bordetella petrii]|uniref:prepilin peptidase n=1 Tax=Bordetella petrii TaxID=94624 RepID=UPI00373097DB
MELSAGVALWWLLFTSWNLALAHGDLRYRKVSNRLVVGGLCGVLLWAGAAACVAGWRYPPLWPGWPAAAAGFLVAAPFFLLWQRRWMGAGDVKAIAVLGLAMGPARLVLVLALASLAAGAHALLYLAAARRWTPPARLRQVPYAAYLALGALSAVFIPLSSAWCFWCFS